MMDKNREFEQWQKLKDMEVPVSGKVWKGIAGNLPEKKKDKRFTLLLLAAVSLLLVLMLYLLLDSGKKKNGSIHKNTDNPALQRQKQAAKIEDKQKSFDEAPLTAAISTPEKAINTTNKAGTHTYFSRGGQHATSPTALYQADNETYPDSKLNYNTTQPAPDYSNDNRQTKRRHDGLANRISLHRSVPPKSKNNSTDAIAFSLNRSIVTGGNIINDCFPAKSNTWFLEVYFSPDYASKFLSGENRDYINSRLGTESALFSFSAGVRIGYKFHNHLALKSGLNYTKINERFHQIKKNVIKKKVIIEIDTIKNPDGTQTIKTDTTVKVIYGTNEVQKINSYSMVCVPVLMAYEFNHSNYNVGINAGVLVNIVSYQHGIILDTEGKLDTFDNNNNIFTKNVGLSLYGSVFLGYIVNKDMQLFVEPKFRYYLKSFTLSEYPLRQKYVKYGISLGSRYFF